MLVYKGCGDCVKVCPDNAIAIVDKKARIDYNGCTCCGICNNVCRVGALEMKTPEMPAILEEGVQLTTLKAEVKELKREMKEMEREMGKVRYVVGSVEGPLDLEAGETVIFAGDCTRWEGELHGKHVRISSTYRDKDQVDVDKRPSNDMLLKFFSSMWHCLKDRSSGYLHARGCPVSVADHVNYLSSVGKIANPNLDPRIFIPASTAYWQMRFYRFLNRVAG